MLRLQKWYINVFENASDFTVNQEEEKKLGRIIRKNYANIKVLVHPDLFIYCLVICLFDRFSIYIPYALVLFWFRNGCYGYSTKIIDSDLIATHSASQKFNSGVQCACLYVRCVWLLFYFRKYFSNFFLTRKSRKTIQKQICHYIYILQNSSKRALCFFRSTKYFRKIRMRLNNLNLHEFYLSELQEHRKEMLAPEAWGIFWFGARGNEYCSNKQSRS